MSTTSGSKLLVDLLVEHGLTKLAARAITKQAFAAILAEAMAGKKVVIKGFGTFYAKTGGGFERQGRMLRRTTRMVFKPALRAREDATA